MPEPKFQPVYPDRGPAIALAPMEGVVDAPMRAFLTEGGGYSYCVSEFIRVSSEPPPVKVFHRQVPELREGGRTPCGVPVQVQLLGGDPGLMGEAARVALAAGAGAIDLNFGCPAPTVNRHDGGAVLLKTPSRIRAVVEAVRQAVPRSIPVSAKLRLGWDDPSMIRENAEAAAAGGASWLTIHARTKIQGYAPPADWKWIGEVRRSLPLPIVANGDIWSPEDHRRCAELSGCESFMLGRGALVRPGLARTLAGLATEEALFDWETWLPRLRRFAEICEPTHGQVDSNYTLRRIKQWLRMVEQRHPDFEGFRRVRQASTLKAVLE